MTQSNGLYSEEIADQILEHIEDGGTIESACKPAGMPSARTLRRWRKGECESVSENFGERFDEALSIRLEGFVDDLLQIPRDIDPDSPGELQRARLECENRRWLLSKMLRSQFGDRASVDLSAEVHNPLNPNPGMQHEILPEMAEIIRRATDISMMAEGDDAHGRMALQEILDDLEEEYPSQAPTDTGR